MCFPWCLLWTGLACSCCIATENAVIREYEAEARMQDMKKNSVYILNKDAPVVMAQKVQTTSSSSSSMNVGS